MSRPLIKINRRSLPKAAALLMVLYLWIWTLAVALLRRAGMMQYADNTTFVYIVLLSAAMTVFALFLGYVWQNHRAQTVIPDSAVEAKPSPRSDSPS